MAVDILPGNHLTLLRSGTDYFPALEAAIREARREIYLETYIYEDDRTGRRIADALCEAAARGVAVHLLIDGFGSSDAITKFSPRFIEAGVRVVVFRPEIARVRFRRHRLRRLHRKLVVVDARVAFVGGINIIDDMHTPRQVPPRYDYAVRIEGRLLRPIHDAAEHLWRRIAWVNFRRAWHLNHHIAVDDAPKGHQHAGLVVRDNLRHRNDIEQAYLDAIETAKQEIILANAYFFPGRRFRHALARAAARGVRVVLLLQGRVEYVLLHYASRALYGSLLESGIEIYEYHKSFMHAKVAVIDSHWATVGSSNIDPFSLMLAREANLVVEDRGFALQLRKSLLAAMEQGARVVQKTRWFKKPLWLRIRIWLGYALARFLMGMVGYGGKY